MSHFADCQRFSYAKKLLRHLGVAVFIVVIVVLVVVVRVSIAVSPHCDSNIFAACVKQKLQKLCKQALNPLLF